MPSPTPAHGDHVPRTPPIRSLLLLLVPARALDFAAELVGRRRSSRRGFSLLELIVVLVVLGLLAALAVPTFNRVIERSAVSAAEETILSHIRAAEALSQLDGRSVLVDDDGPGWPLSRLDVAQQEQPLVFWDWLRSTGPVHRYRNGVREQLVTGFLATDQDGDWPAQVARTIPLPPGPTDAVPGTCVEFWVTAPPAGAGPSRLVEHSPARPCELAATNSLPPLP